MPNSLQPLHKTNQEKYTGPVASASKDSSDTWNHLFTCVSCFLVQYPSLIKNSATRGCLFDEDITPSNAQDDPLLDIQDPITKARARQLNLQVSSFLNKSFYDFENRLLPNDYSVLRNHGED